MKKTSCSTISNHHIVFFSYNVTISYNAMPSTKSTNFFLIKIRGGENIEVYKPFTTFLPPIQKILNFAPYSYPVMNIVLYWSVESSSRTEPESGNNLVSDVINNLWCRPLNRPIMITHRFWNAGNVLLRDWKRRKKEKIIRVNYIFVLCLNASWFRKRTHVFTVKERKRKRKKKSPSLEKRPGKGCERNKYHATSGFQRISSQRENIFINYNSESER